MESDKSPQSPRVKRIKSIMINGDIKDDSSDSQQIPWLFCGNCKILRFQNTCHRSVAFYVYINKQYVIIFHKYSLKRGNFSNNSRYEECIW